MLLLRRLIVLLGLPIGETSSERKRVLGPVASAISTSIEGSGSLPVVPVMMPRWPDWCGVSPLPSRKVLKPEKIDSWSAYGASIVSSSGMV